MKKKLWIVLLLLISMSFEYQIHSNLPVREIEQLMQWKCGYIYGLEIFYFKFKTCIVCITISDTRKKKPIKLNNIVTVLQ